MQRSTFFITAAVVMLLSVNAIYAQTKIKDASATGTIFPAPSAVLELESNTRGFLPPRMTTTQMTAITNPATGMLIYNTTDSCLFQYNGKGWKNLCTVAADAASAIDPWLVRGNDFTAEPNVETRTNILGTYTNHDLVFVRGGLQAGRISDEDYNYGTAIGVKAMLSGGTQSNAFGYQAMGGDIPGDFSNAFGYQALMNNGGQNNSAFGHQALMGNGSTPNYYSDNSAFGAFALTNNKDAGSQNSAFGRSAMENNGTGQMNSAFGTYALRDNRTGYWNSAFGYNALSSLISGETHDNTAIGANALFANKSGKQNTAVGRNALGGSTNFFGEEGAYNTAVGYYALNGNNGYYNTAIGYMAGQGLQSGNNNIFIGNVDNFLTTIGGTLQPDDSKSLNKSNTMNIGNTLYGTDVNNINPAPTFNGAEGAYEFTSNTTGRIGINIYKPTATLDINNDYNISGGSTTMFPLRVRNLPVGGNWMVAADDDGNIYKQAIPGGGVNDGKLSFLLNDKTQTGFSANTPDDITYGGIYAPTTSGDSGTVLISQGPGKPPTWGEGPSVPLNVTPDLTESYTADDIKDDIILFNINDPNQTLTLPTEGVVVGKKLYVSNIGNQPVGIADASSTLRGTQGTNVGAGENITYLYIGNGKWIAL